MRRVIRLGIAYVVVVLALSGLMMAHDASAQAITIQTSVTLDQLPTDELVLVGLASEAADEVVSVGWGRGQSAWFPVWQLAVKVGDGITLTGTPTVPQVTPQTGHTYETTLSFDPDLGLLALRMVDVTTGEVLVRQGWSTSTYSGTVEVAEVDGVVAQRVSPWYEPVDVRWDAGMIANGGFVTLQTLEPGQDNHVRVQAQGPLPGAFRVVSWSDSGERIEASEVLTDRQAYLELPAHTLAAGRIALGVEYVEDGQVRFSERRFVQVGAVTVAPKVTYNRELGTFDVTLQLLSESHLTDLDLDVVVSVNRLEWDGQSRTYNRVPVAEHQTLLQGVDVTGSEPVSLRIPAPSDAASWRLDFVIEGDPDVSIRMNPATAYVSTHAPVEVAEGNELTIAIFPDTQHYAKSSPDIYMRMAEWLAANAVTERIAFALHVGDITEDNARDQWRVARDAHGLMDGVIPYVLTVGNHDYAPSGVVAERSATLVNQYWSVGEFPHLIETMQDGRLENAYYEFEVAGTQYLVVALEFAPSDEALAWANDVVAAHPDHTVLVVTHTYLHPNTQRMASGRSAETFPLGQNPATTMNDGEDIWRKFVSKHPNIVFVVNGHIHSDAIPYRVSVGDHGNRVLQMLVDFQAGPQGGEGYLVLVRFGQHGQVSARAYSPYLDADKRGFDPHGNIVPVTISVGW